MAGLDCAVGSQVSQIGAQQECFANDPLLLQALEDGGGRFAGQDLEIDRWPQVPGRQVERLAAKRQKGSEQAAVEQGRAMDRTAQAPQSNWSASIRSTPRRSSPQATETASSPRQVQPRLRRSLGIQKLLKDHRGPRILSIGSSRPPWRAACVQPLSSHVSTGTDDCWRIASARRSPRRACGPTSPSELRATPTTIAPAPCRVACSRTARASAACWRCVTHHLQRPGDGPGGIADRQPDAHLSWINGQHR